MPGGMPLSPFQGNCSVFLSVHERVLSSEWFLFYSVSITPSFFSAQTSVIPCDLLDLSLKVPGGT